MATRKTLLIVDDHTLFREGLKTIISRNPAYEVVGETGRGETAIQMAKSLRPDLILVDISLPDQSGIELTLQLRKSLPKAFIMMVIADECQLRDPDPARTGNPGAAGGRPGAEEYQRKAVHQPQNRRKPHCFGTVENSCERTGCAWREYCLTPFGRTGLPGETADETAHR